MKIQSLQWNSQSGDPYIHTCIHTYIHISSILLENCIYTKYSECHKRLTEQAANSKSNHMQKVRNIGKHKVNKAKERNMVKSKPETK